MLFGPSINNNSTATTNYASNEKKEKIVITEIPELLKNFRYQIKTQSGEKYSGDICLPEPNKYNKVKGITTFTVKIRSGWDSNHINAVEIAKIVEKAGAKAICVHPRTRSQGYSGKADWDIIKEYC